MFLNLSHDIMIVTDRDHAGAMLLGAPNSITGHMISGDYTDVLIKALSSGDPVDIGTMTELMMEIGGLRDDGRDRTVKEIALDILEMTPGITMSRRRPRIDKKREEETREGFLHLNEIRHWHPDGKLTSFVIDRFTATLVEGRESIRDLFEPSRGIEIAGILENGPIFGAQANGCAACGACGVCGACALCGEVNAAVGATALAGTTALVGLSESIAVNPDVIRGDFDIMAVREENLRVLDDLKTRIAKMNDIARG